MPVDTTNEAYDEKYYDWKLIENSLAGERKIKEAGALYVPAIDGQSDQEYASYISRGSYYAAYSRTVQGFTGSLLKQKPEINVPKTMELDLEAISSDGLSLHHIINNTAKDVMSYGRYGLFVDATINGDVTYISEYKAVNILNWDTTFIDGKETLTFISLKEYKSVESDDDPFVMIEIEMIRVLELIDNKFTVSLWEKVEDQSVEGSKKSDDTSSSNWIQVAVDGSGSKLEDDMYIQPKIRGKVIDYIPFVCIGSDHIGVSVQKPPLLDLANINISHWRLSVDYHYGLHICALPTPYAIGFPENSKFHIGPGRAWQTDDVQASCGFLEFTGKGLDAVAKAMETKVIEMSAVGSRMIYDKRAGVEAAETARIRQSGETSVLSQISTTIEEGIKKTLIMVADRKGIVGDVDVVMSDEFIDIKLESSDIDVLLKSLQSGAISQDTFLYNLEQGKKLPAGRTIDEEKLIIESEGFTGFTEPEDIEDEED